MNEILSCVFLGILLYGAFLDLVSFEIPNYISVVVTILFFPVVLWDHWSFVEIISNFSAGGLVLLVGIILFSFNLIGAADVKILAAAAVWFGFPGLPSFLLAVALSGGVLALVLIVFRRFILPISWQRFDWLVNLHKEQGVPYGVAISVGAVLVSPQLLTSDV